MNQRVKKYFDKSFKPIENGDNKPLTFSDSSNTNEVNYKL